MKLKDKYTKIPANTIIDGVSVGIGGSIKLKDGTTIKEANKTQYKKIEEMFPSMFEKVTTAVSTEATKPKKSV